MRPFPSKAPTASLPPLPLRLLPGGANQFPGGSCTRWSPAPFTAHCYANYQPEMRKATTLTQGKKASNCILRLRNAAIAIATGYVQTDQKKT
jgi:hypothetical protein